MRPPALAALVLTGCLAPNPAFDEAAGDGAGSGSGGATTTTTATTTTGATDMSSATGTTEGGGSASASTGDASTGQPPSGPTLCGAPFDPAAIQPGAAVAGLNSDSFDLDMWLSADGLTIYFSSGRETAPGDSYRATRTARDQPFGAVLNNVDIALSTADAELKIALTDDALRCAISTVTQSSVIVTAARDSPGASFGARTLLPLTHPQATGFVDPHLSPGGDRLYAATLQPGDQTLAAFHLPGDGAATPLDPDPFAAINALSGSVFDPSLSADERVLIFGHRPEGQDDTDLWYATRDDLAAPFGDPAPLVALNTDGDDNSPHVSADGCEIFFARDPSLAYAFDIYRAAVVP